jgi:hypothetical protein
MLPRNPVRERSRALAVRALPLREIARSAQASFLDLLTYAGCRDNPAAMVPTRMAT